jgi:hypothetical protein
MNPTRTQLEDEERRVRERRRALRQELKALDALQEKIARDKENLPRVKGIETGFRIVAATPPATHEPTAPQVVIAPAPEKPADPMELVRRLPRGAAFFSAEPQSGQLRLFVRTGSEQIAALSHDPAVEFRAGLFTPSPEGPVLVPVLIRIGSEEPHNIYEAWANLCPGGLLTTMSSLAEQRFIIIFLHGDGLRHERTLMVPNSLQAFAREVLMVFSGERLDPADAVHQVRQLIYRKHPTIRSLWRALKN